MTHHRGRIVVQGGATVGIVPDRENMKCPCDAVKLVTTETKAA